MEKQNKRKNGLTTSQWLNICIGVILLSLTIIVATNETIVGEALTYLFSYFFGAFYPFVLFFFGLLSLRMIYSQKVFPVKGKGLFWIGFVFVAISVLTIGSYSLLQEESTLSFTSFVQIYENRMLSYADKAWQVTDFSYLGSLGGGFIGLLLVTLFGSAIGAAGTLAFFIILLVIGLVFVCYSPVKTALAFFFRKKEKPVSYNSPYQKKKEEKTETALDVDDVKNKNIFGKLSLEEEEEDSFASNFYNPERDAGGVFKSTSTVLREKNPEVIEEKPVEKKKLFFGNRQSKVAKTAASNTAIPTGVGEVNKEELPREEVKAPQGFFRSNNTKPVVSKETPALETKSSQATEKPQEDKLQTFLKEREESYAPVMDNLLPKEEKPTSTYKPTQEEDLLASSRAKAFRDTAYSKDNTTFEVLEEEPEVKKEEPVKAETKPIAYEVAVEGIEKEEPEPVEEVTEEDLEEQYFRYKANKEALKAQKEEEERNRKMAGVLCYVSDKPRRYNYKLPDESLLTDRDDSDKMEANTKSAQDKAAVINQVFQDFSFPAKAVSFTIGASVTRFNVQTEPGVKADRIEGYLSEIQRALNGDQSVRIQTVVEGRSTSGIEVGNSNPMAVTFKSVFEEIQKDKKENLLIPIGKDISGNIVTFPLNEMPHLLVAGTTGSGKSVLVNCMIMTLIMRNYPSQMKLMLIDPKQVEFAKYQLEPHLFCPVIQDSENAITALRKLCDEMDQRYSLLRQWGCVKISEYRMKRKGREEEMKELPDIVVVIDEFADLMNTGGGEIADYVQRLTQKSRAAGIYMIIATQRPSKDAIPMIIKSNIACRIGLCCSSQVDSRVILDENGCEALIGRGDLLFKCPGKKSLIRCQSAFISSEEMDRVLENVRTLAGDPNYDPDFLDLEPEKEEPSVGDAKSIEDLYADVQEYVMMTGICSKSAIMRNFSITHLKADQMIQRLRMDGIVKLIQGGKNIVVKRRPMED